MHTVHPPHEPRELTQFGCVVCGGDAKRSRPALPHRFVCVQRHLPYLDLYQFTHNTSTNRELARLYLCVCGDAR